MNLQITDRKINLKKWTEKQRKAAACRIVDHFLCGWKLKIPGKLPCLNSIAKKDIFSCSWIPEGIICFSSSYRKINWLLYIPKENTLASRERGPEEKAVWLTSSDIIFNKLLLPISNSMSVFNKWKPIPNSSKAKPILASTLLY